MDIRPHAIEGLLTLVPARHGDERGWFSEIFRDDWFRRHVADVGFVQDNMSLSAAPGTIRGLHFQVPPSAQGKLVRCVSGAILDVAVDLRRGSATYGRHAAVELTPADGAWLWIPAGFAHGFETLRADSTVLYKVTAAYSRADERGIAFDDPALGIEWRTPSAAATISAKDRSLPPLSAVDSPFRMPPLRPEGP